MLLRRGRFDLSLGASKYSFVVAFGSSCFSGISDPAVPCLGHGSHWLLRPRLSKNFLPRLSDEWTLKWSQKKDLYGKKHLISVGGKIEGWTNMVDEPKVNDRAKDAPEPVCFFSPPIELMEELLHTFLWEDGCGSEGSRWQTSFCLFAEQSGLPWCHLQRGPQQAVGGT